MSKRIEKPEVLKTVSQFYYDNLDFFLAPYFNEKIFNRFMISLTAESRLVFLTENQKIVKTLRESNNLQKYVDIIKDLGEIIRRECKTTRDDKFAGHIKRLIDEHENMQTILKDFETLLETVPEMLDNIDRNINSMTNYIALFRNFAKKYTSDEYKAQFTPQSARTLTRTVSYQRPNGLRIHAPRAQNGTSQKPDPAAPTIPS